MAFSFNGLTSEVTIGGSVSSEPAEQTVTVIQSGNGGSTLYTCPANKVAYIIGINMTQSAQANETNYVKINGVNACITKTNSVVTGSSSTITWAFKNCPKIIATQTVVFTASTGYSTITLIELDA